MTTNNEDSSPGARMERCLEIAAGLSRGRRSGLDAEIGLEGVEADSLPGEQIRARLEEVITGPRVEESLQWLHDVGLLAIILPELDVTVNFTQEMGRRHKDVWKHTKQVVAQSDAAPAIRWAALLHDIGKVPTRAITPNGKVTFHGHAEVGARMFDKIAWRLAFPGPLRREVRFLILHHLRANQYDPGWTDSAVRRFDLEMKEHLDELLLLSRADITSARAHKVQAAQDKITELVARMAAVREIDSRRPPLPSGLGNLIMERLDLEPGRIIGDLKRALEAAIEEGALEPHQEPEYYLEYLEKNSTQLQGNRG